MRQDYATDSKDARQPELNGLPAFRFDLLFGYLEGFVPDGRSIMQGNLTVPWYEVHL